MRNKRRIFVTIHYRGQYSLREHRQRLGHAAYHWGILITPKTPTGKDCHLYDASDGMRPDPITGEDHNPTREWYFRANTNLDLDTVNRLLGRVMVGKVADDGADSSTIQARLEAVPLPVNSSNNSNETMGPEQEQGQGQGLVQNCVSWVKEAVRKLQGVGFVEEFEVDGMMDAALRFADECMKKPDNRAVMNYTRRPM